MLVAHLLCKSHPSTRCVGLSRGISLTGAVEKGSFLTETSHLSRGLDLVPSFCLCVLLGQGKLYQGAGSAVMPRPYRVVPKRSGRTRARGDIMGGDGAVGHVQSSYSLLLHPSSSTVIFCGGSRGSTGSCSCKCWLKGSINRVTEQVAEEAHRISLAAGSTDDAGVGRLLPNTWHEEACY
jgi:hypothetical protein